MTIDSDRDLPPEIAKLFGEAEKLEKAAEQAADRARVTRNAWMKAVADSAQAASSYKSTRSQKHFEICERTKSAELRALLNLEGDQEAADTATKLAQEARAQAKEAETAWLLSRTYPDYWLIEAAPDVRNFLAHVQAASDAITQMLGKVARHNGLVARLPRDQASRRVSPSDAIQVLRRLVEHAVDVSGGHWQAFIPVRPVFGAADNHSERGAAIERLSRLKSAVTDVTLLPWDTKTFARFFDAVKPLLTQEAMGVPMGESYWSVLYPEDEGTTPPEQPNDSQECIHETHES